MTPTRAQILRAAKAICRKRCAALDEPCCIEVAAEHVFSWPPPGCANPGCIALASCALDAALNREAEAGHPAAAARLGIRGPSSAARRRIPASASVKVSKNGTASKKA